MRHFRIIPDKTDIPFLRLRRGFFVFSAILIVLSIVLLFVKGLNFGIDFEGGILIEVGTEQTADIAGMRATLGDLGLGEVSLQEFGSDTDVLIRIERQPGDAEAQQAAITVVRNALEKNFGSGMTYRRTEFVGPKVGAELIQAGIIAMVLSIALMLVYIWFRFELPFAIGAIIALVHDVVLTLGMFALFGLEFNLAIVAAILLIVGYSMNDTVVVYDRVRENLRKYKKMPLVELLNVSVNDTLSRTVMTSLTTLLALAALLIFGGEVIRDFTIAMIWGVVIGTYSSVFIAAAALMTVKPGTGTNVAPSGFGAAERTKSKDSIEDDTALQRFANLPAPDDEDDDDDTPPEPDAGGSRASRRATSSRARRNKRRRRKR
ncbi:MAG: protein translocase subunit SecF [Rhodospirillaceae bacterium]|jgi:preprotein translocase subunit SecF|nr:protein translocase subunit SecF [Rhodospirillaceae bacterium]MBT4425386.1 protein translocase subunit SecF [Rhodospirillaceae bacterium]MBT5039924.1 protein translocase subunit SecF [Rhodospirillaceae bacterium]MBT5676580.1 protein translocase subunit SecF [Rhodospirillaceae bacterium]MBT7291859.1 protein translocase subunit SecF [Rhodospirillaceae bacterium]